MFIWSPPALPSFILGLHQHTLAYFYCLSSECDIYLSLFLHRTDWRIWAKHCFPVIVNLATILMSVSLSLHCHYTTLHCMRCTALPTLHCQCWLKQIIFPSQSHSVSIKFMRRRSGPQYLFYSPIKHAVIYIFKIIDEARSTYISLIQFAQKTGSSLRQPYIVICSLKNEQYLIFVEINSAIKDNFQHSLIHLLILLFLYA